MDIRQSWHHMEVPPIPPTPTPRVGAVPRLKTNLRPRCRQYSDINAAAILLAQIAAAPKTALRENSSGYVLVRHNDTAVSARADGQCTVRSRGAAFCKRPQGAR